MQIDGSTIYSLQNGVFSNSPLKRFSGQLVMVIKICIPGTLNCRGGLLSVLIYLYKYYTDLTNLFSTSIISFLKSNDR